MSFLKLSLTSAQLDSGQLIRKYDKTTFLEVDRSQIRFASGI